jgi:hypothetical protein
MEQKDFRTMLIKFLREQLQLYGFVDTGSCLRPRPHWRFHGGFNKDNDSLYFWDGEKEKGQEGK